MFDWVFQVTQAFASWLVQLVANAIGVVFGLLLDLLLWLLSFFGPVLRIALVQVAIAVGDTLNILPVPGFISSFQAQWAAVPWATLGFFLAPFEVEYALTVLVGARVLKFGLRVIPFVGVMFRSPS